jgi:hypothetical protein
MALQPFGPWPLFLIHTQSVGLFGRGISRLKAATYSQEHKQNKRTQTSMPRVEFEPHYPSVRAGEDGSCLRPHGHCDRRIHFTGNLKCVDTGGRLFCN